LYKGSVQVSNDSGTVSYGSPYHTNYFSKGAGNSVPLIDGDGQSGWAQGTVDLYTALDNRIVATQPSYQPTVSASRDVSVDVAGFTETTTLNASDGIARRLGVVFQTGCTVAPLSGLAVSAEGTQPPANTATGYWSGMVAYTASANWTVQLGCAGASLTYSVSGPEAQTVFIGTGPTTPLPASRPVLYYETYGTQAQFSTRISD
jgi:hypothetical protein